MGNKRDDPADGRDKAGKNSSEARKRDIYALGPAVPREQRG